MIGEGALVALVGAVALVMGALIGALGNATSGWISTKAQRSSKRLELAVGLARADTETRLRIAENSERTVEILPVGITVHYLFRSLELIENGDFDPVHIRLLDASLDQQVTVSRERTERRQAGSTQKE